MVYYYLFKMFFYLYKVLFSGLLQLNSNFVDAQNNSKYLDWAPLNSAHRRLQNKMSVTGSTNQLHYTN